MTITRWAKFLGLTTLFVLLSAAVAGQQPEQRDLRPRNCAIQGRVTINSQPAASAQVFVFEIPADWNSPLPLLQTASGSISRTAFKARTDGDGRYQIANLPPGRYTIRPASRAFVAADRQLQSEGLKIITLDAGETRENINFTLVRGGVITGQITDAEGRPVIAHNVRFRRVTTGPDGQPQFQGIDGDLDERQTDDRGVYRIYGLPPGNYIVGAGGGDDSLARYPRMFYPEARNEKQAKVIEVKTSSEVSGINIRLGAGGKTFEVAGRVIEADTGKPIPNIHISSVKLSVSEEGNNTDNFGDGGDSSSGQSDRQGNFRLTGLDDGKYKVGIYAGWMEQMDFYAEPMTFELNGGDLSGLEIKALRGGVISGGATVEGSNDPADKSKLARVQVIAHTAVRESPGQPVSHHQTFIKPDGTFLITGVAPGKMMIRAYSLDYRSLHLTRIEREGSEVKDFIEVGKGEKITGVQLIFTAGSGVIRGQVQTAAGQLPAGSVYFIQANLIGSTVSQGFSAQIDEKGRFELAKLLGGEYELQLNSHFRTASGQYEGKTLATQRVTVAAGAEVQVTINYDPNRKRQEER